MVDFEKVFFRQVSAAVITIAVYTILTGELKSTLMFLWFYIGILMVQEYIIEKIEGRKQHGKRKSAVSGGCRESA